jgi:RNA polymerase sigma-70 factor (ECF subfamily)
MSAATLAMQSTTMSEELEKEFIDLLDANQGILYKITRLYAEDQEDEKDLRQEIIFQAWRSFPRFEGRAKFSTWLYKIALNTSLTHIRKESPKKAELKEVQSESLSNDSRELLIQYIRHFSDIEKLVIMLHLDGYPNEEIASISGLSKNHVAVKLHRLKTTLAERLQKNR